MNLLDYMGWDRLDLLALKGRRAQASNTFPE